MNDDERDFAEEQWNEDNLLRPTQFYWTAMRGNGTSHVECVNSRIFDDRKECYTNMVKFLDASKHGDWEYGVKELHEL